MTLAEFPQQKIVVSSDAEGLIKDPMNLEQTLVVHETGMGQGHSMGHEPPDLSPGLSFNPQDGSCLIDFDHLTIDDPDSSFRWLDQKGCHFGQGMGGPEKIVRSQKTDPLSTCVLEGFIPRMVDPSIGGRLKIGHVRPVFFQKCESPVRRTSVHDDQFLCRVVLRFNAFQAPFHRGGPIENCNDDGDQRVGHLLSTLPLAKSAVARHKNEVSAKHEQQDVSYPVQRAP